ncbi:MAG: DUF928 domain-containing protein, partial [Waterburya sp.]
MKLNSFKYLNSHNSSTLDKPSQFRFSKFKSFLGFFALGVSILPIWQIQAIAQSDSDLSTMPTQSTQFKVTFDPPAEDMPKRTTGGASRTISQCVNQLEYGDIPFSALLPASTRGLTAASHPTILAYLPETDAQKVFFSWREENNQDHYQAILPIANRGGIISLNLPENAPPLEVGKNYQWAIAIMCDDRLQPDSPMVQGQVQRVELASAIESRLDNDISLNNAALYGETGLWYEMLATLAQLKTAQPNNQNLALNWSNLLSSVGLAEVAEAPLNIN